MFWQKSKIFEYLKANTFSQSNCYKTNKQASKMLFFLYICKTIKIRQGQRQRNKEKLSLSNIFGPPRRVKKKLQRQNSLNL